MELPIRGQTVYVMEDVSYRVVEGEIRDVLNYPQVNPHVTVYSAAWLCTTRSYRWGINCFESRERAETFRHNFICFQIQDLQAQIDELRATL